MRTYTRVRVLGATYFFTVNLAERHGNDLLTQHIDALRDAFRVTKQAHPFLVEAMVVLPDHLHCLWRLPPDDNDFPMRGRLIKAHFFRMLPHSERIRQEGVQHSATTSSPTFSSAELDTMLAKAVDAQRLDINTQAGPSNSPHLNALNKLQQRRFKPAAGGIEIPFTPNSLLGGGEQTSHLPRLIVTRHKSLPR